MKLSDLPPEGNASKHELDILVRSLEQNAALKLELQLWLVTQGIPRAQAQRALPQSLAQAWTFGPYLRAWRNRVNPNFALLGGEEDEAEAETQTTNVPPPAQATSSAQDPAAIRKATEALFTQVQAFVAKLVSEAKLTLDPAAKEQIRTLAKNEGTLAAEAVMLANAKPREIVIRDETRGTTTNIGLQHERMPMLLRACGARDHRGFRLNVWLTGPTGSGKTSACESVAKALALPFGSDGSLDADYKVLGFRDANGHIISTQFLDIYENGGIYVADEIDNWLPSALLALNAALANGFVASPKGLIRRHPDACVIACANTWGLGATNEYVGRTKLDAASLDRFHPKISWPYDLRLERAIAEASGEAFGTAWHELIVALRTTANTQGLKVIISPRATFTGIALLKSGFSAEEVLEMTVNCALTQDQKAVMNRTARDYLLAVNARCAEAKAPLQTQAKAIPNFTEAFNVFDDENEEAA